MRERLAKGMARLANALGAGKLASRLLRFRSMKRDSEATQAAIEAIKAARAATDAATDAVNAAAAALNAAGGTGESSPIVVGAPPWSLGNVAVPGCPSKSSGGKFRRIKGGISSRR